MWCQDVAHAKNPQMVPITVRAALTLCWKRLQGWTQRCPGLRAPILAVSAQVRSWSVLQGLQVYTPTKVQMATVQALLCISWLRRSRRPFPGWRWHNGIESSPSVWLWLWRFCMFMYSVLILTTQPLRLRSLGVYIPKMKWGRGKMGARNWEKGGRGQGEWGGERKRSGRREKPTSWVILDI